jgi:tRNA1Val (adenine37-N6)-methyltransferase
MPNACITNCYAGLVWALVKIKVMSHVESEKLLPKVLKILQTEDGYRYSIDPFLLAAFVSLPAGAKVVDLGSGSGVISLLLSQKDPVAKVVGLELQDALVKRSRRTVALNGFQDRVKIVLGDVRDLPANLVPGSFDVVVSNPPYRSAVSGRLASGDERSRARHELAGGLVDFLNAAHCLLKPGGRFFIVYLSERLPELMAEMRGLRIEPKRLRMVCSRAGGEARLILVEGRKNARPGMKVESPLVIYKGAGRDYSDEVLAMYGMTVAAISNQ